MNTEQIIQLIAKDLGNPVWMRSPKHPLLIAVRAEIDAGLEGVDASPEEAIEIAARYVGGLLNDLEAVHNALDRIGDNLPEESMTNQFRHWCPMSNQLPATPSAAEIPCGVCHSVVLSLPGIPLAEGQVITCPNCGATTRLVLTSISGSQTFLRPGYWSAGPKEARRPIQFNIDQLNLLYENPMNNQTPTTLKVIGTRPTHAPNGEPIPADAEIFNAPRPMSGNFMWVGDFLHGVFYTVIFKKPNEPNAWEHTWHKDAISLDGWIIEYVSREDAIRWTKDYYAANYPDVNIGDADESKLIATYLRENNNPARRYAI